MARNLRLTDEQLQARIFDWTFLNDAFPDRITVSDLDGMVEMSGHFLFIEVKALGAKKPTGQRICLERLALTSPYITIIYLEVEYENNRVRQWETLWMGKNGSLLTDNKVGDNKKFFAKVQAWAVWARRHPRPDLRRKSGR